MSRYSQNTQNQANGIAQQILSMDEQLNSDYGLIVDKTVESTITLAEDTVSERTFIAAEDLYNATTGVKMYSKGDTINSGVTFKGDWKVIDTELSDDVLAFDRDEPTHTFEPEDKDEINNGTDDTATGMNRDVDAWMYDNYSDATEWVFGYVSDDDFACSFEEGDDLSCLGHLFDSNRQNAIVLSSTDPVDPELVAPAMAQYNNIDSFGQSISKYRMTAIAANGNEFMGSFLVNYKDTYMDINERINLFVNDINTGLEAVGIHLNGEDSTITLVGSVNLRQHSSTSYDTLNVFDNLNTKRVEVSPFEIPKRSSTSSGIDITKKDLKYISTTKTAPKTYIKYNKWKDWDGPFWYSWVYSYELTGYNVSLTTTVDLGNISANTLLDLSKLYLHFSADTYLVGSVYTSNHGTGKQSVTTLTYTLKKNGVAVSGKNKVNLLNNPSLSINGINTADITMNITGTFLDDYTISTSGNYSLEFNAAVTVYAYKQYSRDYSNYYYDIDSRLRGDVTVSLAKAATTSNDVSNRKLNIGTNGLSFVGNNSRYFYAATDGYEMKWDDASIQLDSSHGLKVNKLYRIISSGEWIDKKYDIIIANYNANGYTCYLPDATEFGNGRTLTVIGFLGLKLKCSGNDQIRLPLANQQYEATELTFNSSMQVYSLQLIAANAGWYVVSYIQN